MIRGYTTLLDHRQLDGQIEAFIELRFAPGTQVADVDDSVIHHPRSSNRSRSQATPTPWHTCASVIWTT